ncbi:hypothetical protein ACQPW3_11480 [Actinosynnema sp. CA-248983]
MASAPSGPAVPVQLRGDPRHVHDLRHFVAATISTPAHYEQ